MNTSVLIQLHGFQQGASEWFQSQVFPSPWLASANTMGHSLASPAVPHRTGTRKKNGKRKRRSVSPATSRIHHGPILPPPTRVKQTSYQSFCVPPVSSVDDIATSSASRRSSIGSGPPSKRARTHSSYDRVLASVDQHDQCLAIDTTSISTSPVGHTLDSLSPVTEHSKRFSRSSSPDHSDDGLDDLDIDDSLAADLRLDGHAAEEFDPGVLTAYLESMEEDLSPIDVEGDIISHTSTDSNAGSATESMRTMS
ncbi:MAG: hypothetical protein Q9227_003929 [Pyrenula ochraceoflavens]